MKIEENAKWNEAHLLCSTHHYLPVWESYLAICSSFHLQYIPTNQLIQSHFYPSILLSDNLSIYSLICLFLHPYNYICLYIHQSTYLYIYVPNISAQYIHVFVSPIVNLNDHFINVFISLIVNRFICLPDYLDAHQCMYIFINLPIMLSTYPYLHQDNCSPMLSKVHLSIQPSAYSHSHLFIISMSGA